MDINFTDAIVWNDPTQRAEQDALGIDQDTLIGFCAEAARDAGVGAEDPAYADALVSIYNAREAAWARVAPQVS